jgi:23S rRNA pseudouridine2605 synthase
MRLIQYLARSGVASRRKAEGLIRSGDVSVNGQVVDHPAHILEDGDTVTYRGNVLEPEQAVVYVVNKPLGVVSTARDPQGRPVVTELVKDSRRLYPVGRLDADTSGLLLLTNDGDLAAELAHPSHGVLKTYRATVRGAVGDDSARQLRDGVELRDGVTAPASVAVVRKLDAMTVLEISIREGRNRQVRRMCAAVGHPVRSLQRTAIGGLKLGGLAVGGARRLRQQDLQRLRSVQ